MWDLVKGLTKVQQDNVDLFLSVGAAGNLMNSGYKLRLARALSAKSVLAVIEDLVSVKVTHDVTVDDVFKHLARYGRE